jgi:exodeoxyribonuclease VIII
MKPGIYLRGQVDYAAIDAVNYSTLKELARSPLHYRYRVENQRSQTKAMFRGSAAHTAILEPIEFMRRYVVFDGKRRAGKAWEAFEQDNADKTILKEDEFNEALAMRDAVRACAPAMEYLRRGKHEATLVWVDPETGVLCKGRPDFITDSNVIVDVKTTRNPEPFWFSRDVARLQYHVQCAFYADGLAALTGCDPAAAIIAVESAPPHDVAAYRAPDAEVLGPGRDAYRSMLQRLCECRREGRWPGIANGFEMTLTLPPWAVSSENELDAIGLVE